MNKMTPVYFSPHFTDFFQLNRVVQPVFLFKILVKYPDFFK